jgi:hypothetical protein
MTTPQGFLDALVYPQRAPELADVDDIFGFLIGSWELEAVLFGSKGHSQRSKGELHASWVLEGRAMQDLFIFPRRADRKSSVPSRCDRYATTIRTYDRMLQSWRVNFVNPAAEQTSAQLIACRNGEGIKMEGKLSDGTPIRWRYVTIEPTSFHYTAERRCNDGTWQLYLELFGTRSGSIPGM